MGNEVPFFLSKKKGFFPSQLSLLGMLQCSVIGCLLIVFMFNIVCIEFIMLWVNQISQRFDYYMQPERNCDLEINKCTMYSTHQKKPNGERECEQERNGYRMDIKWIQNGNGTGTERETEREQERVQNGNRTHSVKCSLLGFFWSVLYKSCRCAICVSSMYHSAHTLGCNWQVIIVLP